jgi:TadE-like protein
MDRPNCSDRDARGLVSRTTLLKDRCARDRESGQAMVEFALILFPLLLLVVGIIQFGIGLNYWLDMQRIANQGARWAAVNNWPPDCPVGSAVGDCDGNPKPTLQTALVQEALTTGLQSSVSVQICYPANSGSTTEISGNPVRVRMDSPFDLLPILGWGSLSLRAEATMRLEQSQEAAKGLITGEVAC